MIDLERSKELRIKRANTDWWIGEKAVVGDNGKTYITYITDMGEVHIKELDAKCSRTPSRDYRLCKLNCTYADEHNAPAVCVLSSGRILVAYTGHTADHCIRYRITEKPYDIESFGPEKEIPTGGLTAYVQVFENLEKKQIWMFTRVDRTTWRFVYSADEGETWSQAKCFLNSQAGGLFYFNMHKVDVLKPYERNPHGSEEQFFFAVYGHPTSSGDHTIRSGIFNAEGQLLRTDGTPLDVNLFTGDVIDLETLDVVYASPEGSTVRLLEVSSTLPFRVGFAPFTVERKKLPDARIPAYHSATFRDGKWHISKPICPAGSFLAEVLDGAHTYLGGMAYYYGVGEAGLCPWVPAPTHTNRIYIARFDGADWVLESYLSQDLGDSYHLEQVIRRLPGKDVKIWRPTAPVYAQDNLPVYWYEGVYTAHTGGWHSQIAMYVEYDD